MDCHLWSKVKSSLLILLFILSISLITLCDEIDRKGIYKKDDKYILKTSEICPHITGYAGHIALDITTDNKLSIEDIKILSHSETPSYIRYITQKNAFLEKFIGKNILEVDDQVEAITGATFTTKAIKDEVSYSGQVLNSFLRQEEMAKNSQIDYKILLFALVGLGLNVLYLLYRNKKRFFVYICFFNMIFIFYFFGMQLSIANIIGAFQGFLNSFTLTNLFLLTLFVIFTGRYYCSHMCPFGLFSEYLGYIGRNFKVPLLINRSLKIIGFIYLSLLFTSYYYKFRDISYDMEILNYFYRFDVSDIFFIAGIVFLFLSLFINRFFCRYVCPTGIMLSIIRISSPVKVSHIENCVSCERCKDVCPTGAIYKDQKGKTRIDSLNCIDCYRCTNICKLQNK